jgi:hypothetical protein
MNNYSKIIDSIFMEKFNPNNPTADIPFSRSEILFHAKKLGIVAPKNIGDVVYSYRYRQTLPDNILNSAIPGHEWFIRGQGRGEYCFSLTKLSNILPNMSILPIKIPDYTPAIITLYRLSDEQSILCLVRYNRILDLFLGITAYSMQSHLRTTVKKVGQIEIDEIYIGVNKIGQHFIIPVQAKGGKDKIGVAQLSQDINYCRNAFPHLFCVPIAIYFLETEKRICIFRLTLEDNSVAIVEEKHYILVSHSDIDESYVSKVNTDSPFLLER